MDPKAKITNRQRDPQTYVIIGAAMEVHRQLGCGFLEAVYQEALAVEFGLQNIAYQREVSLPVKYKDRLLNTGYRADFICFGEVLVELKALKKLSSVEDAQVIHYLKATGLQRGLLINFGSQTLENKRFIQTAIKQVENG